MRDSLPLGNASGVCRNRSSEMSRRQRCATALGAPYGKRPPHRGDGTALPPGTALPCHQAQHHTSCWKEATACSRPALLASEVPEEDMGEITLYTVYIYTLMYLHMYKGYS